jgi:autotransporter translocation and assembly factor TamB
VHEVHVRKVPPALGLVIAAVALALILIFRGPLERAALASAIDLATGEAVAFEAADVGGDRAVFAGVRVTSRGDPLLDARRIEVRYRLRDLFPGGARRYGLISVELDGARITLVRHADGSFNVAVPASSAAPPGASDAGAPLDVETRVRGGSLVVLDPWRTLPSARRLRAGGLDLDGRVESAGRSWFRLRGTYGAAAQPFVASGRAGPGGYAVARVRAASLDLTDVVDYFVNVASARFERARFRDVDLYGYAFGNGARHFHLSGSGYLADGAMRVPGIVPSATAMHGRVDLFDGGLAARRLEARLGTVSVRLAGGLYDWGAPGFRLGILARDARLDAVGRLFRFSAHLPLRGRARVATLLEGPAGAPLVATALDARDFAYGRFPVDGLRGRALYYRGAVDVVGARGTYAGLGVTANGRIELGDTAHTRLVVGLDGATSRLPYAAQLAPGAHLHAGGLLAGDGLRLDARGALGGSGGGTDIAGLFHVDPLGDGRLGPVALRRSGGATFAGTFYLDRSESRSGFWCDARDYPAVLVPGDPRLPGVALAPPAFSGILDGALAGEGPPSRFRLAGAVEARALRVGVVTIDDVHGKVSGTLGALRLAGLLARGPWGSFRGNGGYDGDRLALVGNYRGSFERLRTLTGDLAARGPVDGPVALLIDPRRTVVQARADATRGSTVGGVPLDALTGTLALEGRRLRVYAATAGVAGGAFAAAGVLDERAQGALSDERAQRARPEERSGIGVSVAGADARRLGAVASLESGRVAAIGRLQAAPGGGQPRFRGGFSLAGGRVGGIAVAGNGDVTLGGTRLTLRAGDANVASAVGSLDGTVAGFGGGNARYDLGVHVRTARLGPLATQFGVAAPELAGSLDGDLRVAGRWGALTVGGTVDVPEGSVSGLNFSAAGASVEAGAGGFAISHGRVTVGSTVATFGATARGGEAAFELSAPRADLSDFNDLFDAGDTLGGRGRVAARFERRAGRVTTSAAVAIAGLRYRRFDLGDATAQWISHGPRVDGQIGFGGASGRLQTSGFVVLDEASPLREVLTRSVFRGTARVRGLDLGVWLPAVGLQLPVSGRIDADADVSGPLGNPLVRTSATLAGGTLGRFPVDRFVVQATSTARRTTVSRAELDLPSLSLAGSGAFGFGPNDPLALAVHAKTSDVGAVTAQVLGAGYLLRGSGEADVRLDGTRAHPRLEGGFDVEDATLRGVAVPRALGEFSLAGRDVVLSGVEIGFATGTLYAAGSVPLQVAPFGFGPARAPITLDLTAKGIDVADFTSLLPAGSDLAGRIDGRVVIGGTAVAPQLDGGLSLANGRVATPLETIPLSGVNGHVSLHGNEVRLDALRASAGGGTIAVSGRQTFADLVHPAAGTAYRYDASAAHLRLDVPAYLSGTIDGKLSISKRTADEAPRVAGTVALADATVPFSALLLVAGSAEGAGGAAGAIPSGLPPAPPVPLDAAFDLDLEAGRNVRVRSANVDIGARGSLHVAGTRSAPVLSGAFESTGGTITYVNTVFRLIDGTVSFEPDLGVIPTLDAHATTHVLNTDPNVVRNPGGSADITLALHGPVTNLQIALDSNPPYDRQQILGLLIGAPALGATNLFGDAAQSPTLYGSNYTRDLPSSIASTRNPSGEMSVAQEAFGVANAQFTRTLLAPIESSFAEAVGLTNVNVNVDYTGNVGVTARKLLGKNVNAIYGTTFGYPSRQTFGFELRPSDASAAQVTVFQTIGALGLNSLTPIYGTNNARLQASQPTAGTAGFSLSFQHLF